VQLATLPAKANKGKAIRADVAVATTSAKNTKVPTKIPKAKQTKKLDKKKVIS
jgi:hypothetical protein